jgi:hypothetical protein
MATRIMAMVSFQNTVIQASITVESRILIRDGQQLQEDLERLLGYGMYTSTYLNMISGLLQKLPSKFQAPIIKSQTNSNDPNSKFKINDPLLFGRMA